MVQMSKPVYENPPPTTYIALSSREEASISVPCGIFSNMVYQQPPTVAVTCIVLGAVEPPGLTTHKAPWH